MTGNPEQEQYLRTAFLERIAHELRGPAGVIQGVLHELEEAGGNESAQREHLLALARRGLRRILRQAERLQQTGQLERGDAPVVAGRCDLAELVRTTAHETHGFERRRGIDIDVETPTHPVAASLDTRWIAVAIQELTSNALRHARARVQVRLLEDDDGFLIVVRDDNAHPTPFGPSRFAVTRERRGLGLSLSIVDDVATAHGGALEIVIDDSADNPGSEVRLRLPRGGLIPSVAGARTAARAGQARETR